MTKTKKYRFAPKVYGRGFVPISREGRLVTFFMIIVIVGGSFLILGPEEDPNTQRVVLFFVYILLVSLLPIYMLRSRIKGNLKWRRGVKDVDRE